MSLHKLLGLCSNSITEEELYATIGDAIKRNAKDIEIVDSDGSVVKIHIPSLTFDPQLMNSIDSW